MDTAQLTKKYYEIIKTAYKNNFSRDITDPEIEEVLSYLIPDMTEELKKVKGYSDQEFERYIRSGTDLTFSPKNVHYEIIRLLHGVGEEQLRNSGKYKRLREMEIATRFCIANYKKTGQKFMIAAQDNPDIMLVLMGNKNEGKRIPAFPLEVMGIPEIAKNKLDLDLPTALANFIQEKKFTKDYGICSLIVCFDFNQMSLDFNKIAEVIQKIENNPYKSVWLTAVTGDDLTTMSVIQISPGFVRENYNLINEPNLLY